MNTIRQYQVPLQKYMALTELQVVFSVYQYRFSIRFMDTISSVLFIPAMC